MDATNLGSGVMDCETIRKRHLAGEYRAGRLTAEEAEDYERHFFACDRCFAELRFEDHVADRISEEGSSLFAAEAGREKSHREREPSGWRGLLDPARLRSARAAFGLRAGVVAVTVVLAVLAVDHLSGPSSSVRDLWPPTAHPYLASELRGGAGSAEFRRGMEAYVAGRYEEAADWLRRSAEAAPRNGEVPFYLGVSLLMLEDAEGAAAALRTAVEHVPSSALYRWYLAQAELKRGRVEAAEVELNRIVESGREYTDEAQRMLQRISETLD